jgi:hypothetical protein
MNGITEKINTYLASLPEWQRVNLQYFREIIHLANDAITEDWKWNVPVFVLNGKTLFAMSAFKAHTKYNFIFNGARLADPDGLFNNGLESSKSRGIDIREGESIDSNKLRSLIEEAINLVQT